MNEDNDWVDCLTVDQLMALNGITDPDRLTEGQTLKLAQVGRVANPAAVAPASATASTVGQTAAQTGASPPGRTEYAVQPGDTVAVIGGGVMGASVAYHLALRSPATRRDVVLETRSGNAEVLSSGGDNVFVVTGDSGNGLTQFLQALGSGAAASTSANPATR